MGRRLAGGGQFGEHFVPEFGVALAHAVAVDDGAPRVEGYFGGLDGDLELGDEVANRDGHGPGVVVGGAVLGASVVVVKRNEMHTFVVLPKRWVVERSFAWLEKCRRLWKNCERKLDTSLQMVVLAFAALILKRL